MPGEVIAKGPPPAEETQERAPASRSSAPQSGKHGQCERGRTWHSGSHRMRGTRSSCSLQGERTGLASGWDSLEGRVAVAALWCAVLLGHVVKGDLATRGLDLPHDVGLGRVAVTTTVCNTLDHFDKPCCGLPCT